METSDLTSERGRLALVELVFVYPAEPHRRKHAPAGYAGYESYRDWLRDEFSFRCVFSLFRETWPQTRLQIDHLIPQKDRPDLDCDYDNLILLEGRLNLVKGKKRVPDPCEVALGQCLLVHTNGERMGRIEARDGNKLGEQIIQVLRLDSDDATQIRRDWIGILHSVAQSNVELFRKFLGYPQNLPDLAKANAPSNHLTSGIEQSAKHLKEAGELPAWY